MFGPDTDFVIVGGDFNSEPRGKGWESKYQQIQTEFEQIGK